MIDWAHLMNTSSTHSPSMALVSINRRSTRVRPNHRNENGRASYMRTDARTCRAARSLPFSWAKRLASRSVTSRPLFLSHLLPTTTTGVGIERASGAENHDRLCERSRLASDIRSRQRARVRQPADEMVVRVAAARPRLWHVSALSKRTHCIALRAEPCDVVDKQTADRPAVVAPRHRAVQRTAQLVRQAPWEQPRCAEPEALLPGGIPDLQLDLLAADLDDLPPMCAGQAARGRVSGTAGDDTRRAAPWTRTPRQWCVASSS
jgi:hypothetical protein